MEENDTSPTLLNDKKIYTNNLTRKHCIQGRMRSKQDLKATARERRRQKPEEASFFIFHYEIIEDFDPFKFSCDLSHPFFRV